MLALTCLIIGLVSGVISRILLTTAAFRISVVWGVGVFLPFGPLFFRLNYPEEAARSRMFRLLTLFCVLLYVTLGGVRPTFSQHKMMAQSDSASLPPRHYAIEKPAAIKTAAVSRPLPRSTPTLAQRRAANERELAQLQAWGEQLRLRKQSLLPKDTEANRAYAMDLTLYNDALAKATALQKALNDQN